MAAILRRLLHLPGLRGNPLRSYKAAALGPAMPGIFTDYAASLAAAWAEKDDERLELLNEALHTLGLTWKVAARRLDATRIEVKVGRTDEALQGGAQDLVNVADVGFGVSQSLPVAVALVAAGPGQVVYIEQPEIHLHPNAQIGMASLICDAVRRGVQVVAETHSELVLTAVQRAVALGALAPELVKLHWFERNPAGVSRVRSSELDASGGFGDWPADFAEVASRLDRDYVDAAFERRRSEVH